MITMNRETFEMFDEAMRVMKVLADEVDSIYLAEFGTSRSDPESITGEAHAMLDAWDAFKTRGVEKKPKILGPSDSLIASLEAAKASGHITGDGAVVMDFIAQPPKEEE